MGSGSSLFFTGSGGKACSITPAVRLLLQDSRVNPGADGHSQPQRVTTLDISAQDKPGFILNALLVPFNNDAIRAVEAGVADAENVDRAIKAALGYKMGPLELIDLVGLDTQIRLCEAFYPITLDPRAATPPLLRRMVAAGLLGRKSGRGFFTYEGNAMFGA